MSTIVVKSGLVVYMVFALALVVLIWKNAAAPDALKNLGIFLTSILPMLFSVGVYLGNEITEKRFTGLLIQDGKNQRLYFGETYNPYFISYGLVTANLSKEDLDSISSPSELSEDKGMDFIERGVVESLQKRFSRSWDIEYKDLPGPGVSFSETQANLKAQMSQFKSEKLREIFSKNKIIQKTGTLIYGQLILPPKTTISSERLDHERRINIRSRKMDVTIAMRPVLSHPFQEGLWGIFSADDQDKNRFSGCTYTITITKTKNMLFSYSTEMKSLDRWYENILQGISELDWQRINESVEKAMYRNSLSKILGK